MATRRREFDLLCAIVRPRPDLKRAREILDLGVDIDVLLALADRHAVRPALAVLRDLGSGSAWSSALRRDLEAFGRAHGLRSLAMVDELLRIADALTAAGIPFVTFKGPVLALQVHGGLALREYADIDLLVPPERAGSAQALLGSFGYHSPQGSPAFVRFFLGAQRQVSLERSGFEAAVDLHWAFSADALPFPLAPDEIWSRLESVSLGGRPVPTLAPQDLALLLAGHGTKEAWYKLLWVADFARLVDLHPGLDWADLHARARRRGSGDAVLLAAGLARTLLEVPLPPALADALADRPAVAARVERLAASLAAGPSGGPRPHLGDLLLCDRTTRRWWARARTTLTPSPGDYRALPLPRGLWPLYWLTRPFRLLARAALGA